MESTNKASEQSSFFITLLPLFVLAHFAHHLLTALTVPMLPFIRNDFKLNYTQSALVNSAFSLSYGVGQLPAGWAADRFGPRILVTIGIFGVAMAGLLVGISQTFIILIASLVLMGLLGGGYHPASAPLILSSVEPEKRGRALGFHLIGGSASFFLAPLISAAIAGTWGWRGSYIGLAIPTAIFGILFFVLLGQGKANSHIQKMTGEQPVETSKVPGSFRRLTAFLILTVLGGGASFSIMGFIPLYIVDHFGASERTAASLLSVAWAAGLWASPLGGYLSDRIGRVRIILTSSIISGVLIYLLTVVPYGWGLDGLFFMNGLGIGALLFFIGVNSFIRMPVSEAFIMSQAAAHRRSTVYGVYYFAMQQAGGIFAPIVGVIVDMYGFQSCFTIASATVIGVTLICSVFLLGGREDHT
ncbi:MFS transporter [Thermodesulfobacteriota bacterium]